MAGGRWAHEESIDTNGKDLSIRIESAKSANQPEAKEAEGTGKEGDSEGKEPDPKGSAE